jgi:N-terminal domain of galactosyltransferase
VKHRLRSPYTVVILSKRPAIAHDCIVALTGASANKLVVDDTRDCLMRNIIIGSDTEVVSGVVPFVFARNANIGIAAAAPNDVFLLNDDARLVAGYSLDRLALIAQQHPRIGVLCPTIIGLTNDFQRPISSPGWNPPHYRTIEDRIPFVGAYFRREVIELLSQGCGGPFDERFIGYGYEDDDVCRRLTRAGLELALTDYCTFEHGSIPSSFRGSAPAGPTMLGHNRRLFEEKWSEPTVC